MRHVGSLVVLVLALAASPAQALTIDACGPWWVPARETADLATDLDCSSHVTIDLGPGARLRLGGHRLKGRPGDIAISCQSGTCTVEGPGEIAGFGIGVHATGRARRIRLTGVAFTANDAAVSGSYAPPTRVDATDVVVQNGGAGIVTRTLVAERLLLTGNVGPAIDVVTLRGRNVSVTGSGASELGWAVRVRNAHVDGLTVTDNARIGIVASGSLTLGDATVVRNDTAGDGVDIAARRKPILRTSTCGLSRDLDTGLPFGICSGD